MSEDRGKKPRSERKKSVWRQLEEKLESLGVDLSNFETELGGLKGAVKVVCVAPDLGESVREMGESPRDHTVMVRVDEDSLRKLDAWVETGAVKSRSEAAALFIREGLQVRGDELAELEDALRRVEEAKTKLREKAQTVFGRDAAAEGASESGPGDEE